MVVDREVILLWRELVNRAQHDIEEVKEKLLYTDFAPIMWYFEHQLEESDVAAFEAAAEKYFFLKELPIPYPDGINCECTYEHLRSAVEEMLIVVRRPLEVFRFYHFEHPLPTPKNVYCRVGRLGYYGFGDNDGEYDKLQVQWYTARHEIDRRASPGRLYRHCYPYPSCTLLPDNRYSVFFQF